MIPPDNCSRSLLQSKPQYMSTLMWIFLSLSTCDDPSPDLCWIMADVAALEVPHFSPGGERTDVALLWGQAKKSDVGMCI